VPGFVDGFRGRVDVFAQKPGEAHADDVAGGLFGHVENFGVERHDVGLLGAAALLHPVHLDLGEQLRGGVLTDVLEVAGVVGGLQADEVDLGVAHEGFASKSAGIDPAGCASRAAPAAAAARVAG
jgi:hypothetical protein